MLLKLIKDTIDLEVDELLGDPSKAVKELGWSPKVTLEELISEMIKEDKKIALKELTP